MVVFIVVKLTCLVHKMYYMIVRNLLFDVTSSENDSDFNSSGRRDVAESLY
jgi:hypothetical protein